MSRTKVQLVSNIVGNVSGGASFTGIVTASSFTGNITGTASTASFATTSFGLSGSPNITVGNINSSGVVTATTFSGNITGVAATFAGNVTIGGTLTYEDVTNIDSIGLVTARTGVKVTAGGVDVTAGGLNVTAGVSTFANKLGVTAGGVDITDGGLVVTSGVSTFSGAMRVATGMEKVHRHSGNTVTLTYNSTSSSNVGYTTNPSGNVTVNVVGIPTSSDYDDHSITFAVIVNNTGTARTCTAVNLNGVPETIRWAGGSLSAALSGVTTTTGHTIFTFTGINTVGSASTAANYTVLGTVSGGFW